MQMNVRYTVFTCVPNLTLTHHTSRLLKCDALISLANIILLAMSCLLILFVLSVFENDVITKVLGNPPCSYFESSVTPEPLAPALLWSS